MSYDGLVCPSCGARQVTRRDGLFVCSYCKSNVLPRLSGGDRCSDLSKGIICGMPAESLCTSCGRPLCSWHNDPKYIYWQEALSWRRLFSNWSDEDGSMWEKLTEPVVRLPVPGFEPFEWKSFDRDVMFRVGQLEREITDSVRNIVNPLGGDFYETGVRFESICSLCDASIRQSVSDAMSVYSERYKKEAYLERTKAIHDEIRQGISYIESFLKGKANARFNRNEYTSLDLSSPRDAWTYFALKLRERLDMSGRLLSKLG